MGQILNIGFCFFILIMMSSYTANLASNLISANVLSTPLSSINDADSRGIPVCVLAGTVAQTALQSSYSQLKVVPIYSLFVSDLIQAMKEGQCQGSVMSRSDWDMAQLDSTCNSQCNLVAPDTSFRYISGGNILQA